MKIFVSMKTLLLTWGTWYIWSHCAVLLAENNYNIILLDNLSHSSLSVVEIIEDICKKKVKFYKGDIKDKNTLIDVFRENDIDTVLHFAWEKSVWESCEKPFMYYENNVLGTLNILEVMDEFDVKNMIFSSSAAVYNPSNIPPFTEEMEVWNTANPYGTTKLIIENILRDLALHKGFKIWNLRYFNPIGAHSSWKLWENPKSLATNLLPVILRVANEESHEIHIYGNDYKTSDGTWVRDYIHVVDLAYWHMAALKWLEASEKNMFETFNLWTGTGTTVMEMLKLSEEITGKHIPYKVCPRRVWDMASAYCSPQKAYNTLWWESQKTVREWIEDSWNFIKEVQWK